MPLRVGRSSFNPLVDGSIPSRPTFNTHKSDNRRAANTCSRSPRAFRALTRILTRMGMRLWKPRQSEAVFTSTIFATHVRVSCGGARVHTLVSGGLRSKPEEVNQQSAKLR